MPKIHKLSELKFSENFSKPARALKIAVASGGLIAKVLAEKVGIKEQTLSEFLSGRRDGLYTRSLEALVDALPAEQRIVFFQEWMGESVPQKAQTLAQMISLLDPEKESDRKQAAEAFRLIGEKFIYPDLGKNQSQVRENTDEVRQLSLLES